MRFHLAALLLPAALLVAACDENAPPDRDSQNAGVNRTLSGGGAAQPAAQGTAQEAVNIPKGAMWTICCDTYTTPDHVQRAAEIKSQLIRLTGRRDFYVIHKDGESVIYFGFYKAIREDVDSAEHARSQADLQWIRTLADSTTGEAIFHGPLIMPIDGPDPAAPPEWNLANAPADMFWSLQIAAFKDFADRKEAAVDKVRDLRAKGIPAYYYHGDTVSSVCVGLWPITAVKNQAEGDNRYGGSGHTDDPDQPLYVFGGSQAPDNALNTRMDPNTGKMAKVEGIKIDIQDPTLKAMIDRYPYEDVNGEYHYKPLPDGGKFYDQTFLVQVPHEKQADQVATPAPPGASDDLPPLPDTAVPPDPTAGALRSLGDQAVALLIATANPAKAREFRQMLLGEESASAESTRGKFLDLSAFPDAKPVEETGQTFLQNACLKAVGYAKQITADWTLADDSGLEVDALGGAPGVFSARWALRRGILPPTGDADADNNATLLKELADVTDDRRAGRFVCVLALADARGQVIATVRRTIEGRVLRELRGSNGFGYDPLFFVPELGKTTAELPPAEKHRISHRGRALAALSELIAQRHWTDLLGMGRAR